MAYEQEGKVLNIFYQLGLIFLMFLSGYNTNISMNRKDVKSMGAVLIGATVIPMLAGIPFIGLFQYYFIGEKNNFISFGIVFVIAIAITSIPVISKIFFDMGIMNTRFSNTVLTVSTIQDLFLWILLNAATRIADTGQARLLDMILVVLMTVGLFVMVKIVSERISASKQEQNTQWFYGISIVILLFLSAVFSIVGINIMYSAFLPMESGEMIFSTPSNLPNGQLVCVA